MHIPLVTIPLYPSSNGWTIKKNSDFQGWIYYSKMLTRQNKQKNSMWETTDIIS